MIEQVSFKYHINLENPIYFKTVLLKKQLNYGVK